MWVSWESGSISQDTHIPLADKTVNLFISTTADGVSYVVVVFLGDFRTRTWCYIPAGIKNLPSDDFPKPLCFEAEH